MIRITQIKISIDEPVSKVKSLVLKKLRLQESDLLDYRIYKESIDARHRGEIDFIYTVDIKLKDEARILSKKIKNVSLAPELDYVNPVIGSKKMLHRPVVIGFGPAGMFAALLLAQNGYRPIVLERGQAVDERVKSIDKFWLEGKLNPKSNVQFGEGGAGTFSDGKLTTGVKDKRKQFILETFVQHGANEDILYMNKPHVGTDYLINVVKSMREKIIENGGEVLFESQLVDIGIENNRLVNIKIDQNGKIKTMHPDKLVLAIGHSARDTYEMLYQRGLKMEAKPFAVGLRIEHLQSFINEQQYGKYANHPRLKAADYKLAVKSSNGRGVYTFCMCPGGRVINSSSELGGVVVNGMSNQARDDINANSAILVTVGIEDFKDDHPLSGVVYQRELEHKAFELGGKNYFVPVMKVEEYLGSEVGDTSVECSVLPGVKHANLNELFSDEVNQALKEGLVLMNQKISGFTSNAMLLGVESRSSSPVKFERDENYQSNIKGIYPIGEGAGYAGGIMSSALDGLKCSELILKGENK